MKTDTASVDFSMLDDRQFEEFCFDLLGRSGFLNLTWRQGGPDQGRDIQGSYDAPNALVGRITETWFVQCKHYKGGVPPTPLSDAVTWADAQQPQHLLFIVSSYPSNPTRQWLDQISAQKAYGIHTLGGKTLATQIVKYPELVERYFFTEPRRLLRDARSAWASFGIYPSRRHMVVFLNGLALADLSRDELAFMSVSSRFLEGDEDGRHRHKLRSGRLGELDAILVARANSELALVPEPQSIWVSSWGYQSGTDWQLSQPSLYIRFVDEQSRAGVYLVGRLADGSTFEVVYIDGEPTRVHALPPDKGADDHFNELQHLIFSPALRERVRYDSRDMGDEEASSAPPLGDGLSSSR